MTDWQPIETAPKDGTHVLLFYPPVRTYDGVCFVGLFDPEYRGFSHWRGPWGGAIMNNYPTHWMPLPPLPNPPVGFV